MIRRFSAIVATVLLALAAGCSTNTDLGGVKVPNSRPDTRITGGPPTLLEASFAVDLNWTGSDPDGLIVGYEWKISNNGTDGISPRDTLTTDPLTGAVLHPWRFTAANDTTFLLLADQPDFPGDEHSMPRSFRTHSVFIRAVDDKGAVDPTPAYISFTSTTIVPTCQVFYPNLGRKNAKTVPSTVNIGWLGSDPDFELQVPTQVRFLWKSSQYDTDSQGEPMFIKYSYEYLQHRDEVLDFDDPEWSQWLPYASTQEDRMAQFPDQPNWNYFLFALQVRDTAGAVSVGQGYGVEVANLWIKTIGFQPTVVLSEPFLGSPLNYERFNEIAGGQPLNFSWSATASDYNGKIVSYRHGWDLVDRHDANDPGWAVPPGLSKQNLFAPERNFQSGLHTFFLRVEDDSKQVTFITWDLQIVPFVERDKQFPLLVIDQVIDPDGWTNNWADQSGNPRNAEFYRNTYWHFLADGSGGVSDFRWEDRDWKDHREPVFFRDLVNYKAVLCYAQYNEQRQGMFKEFRPRDGVDQFVWLTPYQERGGNFFLVGGSSMESFIEGQANYMVPMIFDSRQPIFVIGGKTFITGFGTIELPDGTDVQRGPLMYPYATAGITAIDWTSVATKTIYGRSYPVNADRRSDCVGLKGLALDLDFKKNHSIGPGVVPDFIYGNPEIDWRDDFAIIQGTLSLTSREYVFPFRDDEFYDGNISSRAEPIILQECDVQEAPGGLCVEPMFRGISRFDWLREVRYAEGETDWPQSRYDYIQLKIACGEFALTGHEGRPRSSALTDGMTFGFMSYKKFIDKPGRKADVYWGFDPYRFNAEDSQKAIRWVLRYFGLTINP